MNRRRSQCLLETAVLLGLLAVAVAGGLILLRHLTTIPLQRATSPLQPETR